MQTVKLPEVLTQPLRRIPPAEHFDIDSASQSCSQSR
jgi:hypothetical protein